MSTTLFFLVPIGMLAVAWTLCFVGCVFHTGGVPGPPYSNQILTEQGLVAYWPLSDSLGAMVPPGAPPLPPLSQNSQSIGAALDLLSATGHHGSYTIPPAYQTGSTIPAIAQPGPKTGLILRQTSIVPGDVSNSDTVDQNLLPACVDFEGGYVNILWAANSAKFDSFTIEAWVKPKWAVNTPGFTWVVFSAQTATAGFALSIVSTNQGNFWQITVGDGAAPTNVNPMVPAAVASTLTYVAVTFDSTSQVLSLWINPVTQESDIPSQPPTPPTPAWPPDPNITTTYVPIDPTQPATFFIGAGTPQLPPRTADGGAGAPQFPFQGWIQDVALYNAALSGTTLASHFANGGTA